MGGLVWGLFLLLSQPEQNDKLLTYLNIDYGNKGTCAEVANDLNNDAASNWYYYPIAKYSVDGKIEHSIDFHITYMCIGIPGNYSSPGSDSRQTYSTLPTVDPTVIYGQGDEFSRKLTKEDLGPRERQ